MEFPTFEMQPLEIGHLQELAVRIRDIHAVALGWDARAGMCDDALRAVVQRAAAVPVQDRSRQTIKQVVSALDSAFDEAL